MTAPNRVVVVDETGRVYDRTGVTLTFHEQDGGLTLKVFVTPLPAEEYTQANADHAARLGRDLQECQELVAGFVNDWHRSHPTDI